jgi:hypothetical protein
MIYYNGYYLRRMGVVVDSILHEDHESFLPVLFDFLFL